MRADRLLSILMLLQTQKRVTARELAERLEVSRRTIYRDMDALGAAGVPVVADRGSGGGWSLLEPYQTNLTGLNQTEIQTLFLTNPARLLADLGLGQASEAALLKLLAGLPAGQRHSAQDVRQRIHIDTAGWRSSNEDLSALPTLQEAIWQERCLHLVYRRGDNTTIARDVEPLGLVAKGRLWYLVAAVEAEIRTYRVSRVQEAELSEQHFLRPNRFDLAAYWSQSAADFVAQLPRYPVTVRVAPDILPWLRYAARFSRIEQIDPPDAAGWHTVQIMFEEEESASQYVLGFGPKIEVLEPADLRVRVICLAEQTVAFYQKGSD